MDALQYRLLLIRGRELASRIMIDLDAIAKRFIRMYPAAPRRAADLEELYVALALYEKHQATKPAPKPVPGSLQSDR